MKGEGLRSVVEALLARPVVYDLVQTLAGRAQVARPLKAAMASLPPGRLLDVGSADGGLASSLDLDGVFIDIDLGPLAALRRRESRSRAVVADAAALPFRDRAFDVSLCVAVSHHLDDRQLQRSVEELGRVTAGSLLFLDALRKDHRRLSRWLWRHDRGRHPRTIEILRAALERRFRLRQEQQFTVYHQYVLWVASPL
jgi:ubiquinone/menaquinone biosynthesis C-methylase UbiE